MNRTLLKFLKIWVVNRNLKKIFFILAIGFLAVSVYDWGLMNSITAKEDLESIRIGYINLHENKITKSDLVKMKKFDCDLWLFLEWNGNNLENDTVFSSTYFTNYELIDKQTFGVAVMSKLENMKVLEVDSTSRPYVCDYPKYKIEYKGISIFFVHAPPPLPKCGYQTELYIDDLLKEIESNNSKIPEMIVGDFNTIPIQSAINKIKKLGFKDSYKKISKLPAGTFGPFVGCPKILKFDYFFQKGNIEVITANRFSINTSDHCGLVGDFKIVN